MRLSADVLEAVYPRSEYLRDRERHERLRAMGLSRVTQTIFGRGPEHNEPAGNCMQAALATALRRPLESVPHFLEHWDGRGNAWWDTMNAWLTREHGLALVGLECGAWQVPPVLHLMVGTTVRSSKHVVVGFAGEFLFDPHPSDAGLAKAEHVEMFIAQQPGLCVALRKRNERR